jgi:hypothetical protein
MLPELELCRRQHEEIIASATALGTLLHAECLDAERVRASLRALLGKLVVHLAAEDRGLYGDLLASRDARVRGVAERCRAEMGGLAALVTDRAAHWLAPAAIIEHPSEFAAELNDLLTQLARRVAVEERDLFPAVEGAQRA